MHFANALVATLVRPANGGIIQARGCCGPTRRHSWRPRVAAAVLQEGVVSLPGDPGLDGTRTGEPPAPNYVAKIEIPCRSLRCAVLSIPCSSTQLASAGGAQCFRRECRVGQAGIVQGPAALQALVLKGIDGLIETTPTAASSHKDWSEFAKRTGRFWHACMVCQARKAATPAGDSGAHQDLARRNQTSVCKPGVAAKHYADLILQPGPRAGDGAPRAALLAPSAIRREAKWPCWYFDGLAFDQWVQIRERLIATTKRFAFDEGRRSHGCPR